MYYYEVKLWFNVEQEELCWYKLNGIQFYECVVKSGHKLEGENGVYVKKYFERNGVEDMFTAAELKTMKWGVDEILPLQDDIVYYDLNKIKIEI